jgi:NADPH-dependent glutamate synthase beta subunit-like oxidoreductase
MSEPLFCRRLCEPCGVCTGSCPGDVFPDLREEEGTLRSQLRGSQRNPRPPCQLACPIGQDIPGYLRALAQGNHELALEVILRDCPLPAVLGHVCPHPCEQACVRTQFLGAPRLRALKRFASLAPRPIDRPQIGTRTRPVTVVGAGPAGLAAAWYLARAGVKVSIREAESFAGGMLAWAIPDFRLPRTCLQQDLDFIVSWGVDLELNRRIYPDEVTALLGRGHSVILACGAPTAATVDLPGAKARGMWLGLDFLRRLSLGPRLSVSGPVVVIGGGNTALDSARSALRLVPDVTLVYRRELQDMPAFEEEIAAALREGLNIREMTEPEAFQEDDRGHLAHVVFHETEYSGIGEDGRRTFKAVPGARHILPAKLCVLALGQESEATSWASGLGLSGATLSDGSRQGEGLYAAGDFVTGPSTVVQAVAGGIACARELLEECQQ